MRTYTTQTRSRASTDLPRHAHHHLGARQRHPGLVLLRTFGFFGLGVFALLGVIFCIFRILRGGSGQQDHPRLARL